MYIALTFLAIIVILMLWANDNLSSTYEKEEDDEDNRN